MANIKFDINEGVWRTIGGRRVFIRTGKSLSQAMKESGKFKSAKRGKKSDEELKKEIGNDIEKLQKYANEEGILPSELQDRLGIKDSDLGLKDEYTEKFEQEMQGMERYLKAEEAKKSTSQKDYSKMSDQDLKDELQHYRNMEYEMNRRLSGRYELSDEERNELERRATHYESTKDEIRSELRKRKGMGPVEKEDRVALKEDKKELNLSQRQIDEGKRLNSKAENGVRDDVKAFLNGKENYNGSREDFIRDLSDNWGVDRNKVEEILHDEIIKHPRNFTPNQQKSTEKNMPEGAKFSKMLEENNVKTFGDEIKEQHKKSYKEYYKKENIGSPSNYKKGENIEFDNGYYGTVKGKIVREATDNDKEFKMNNNLKGYIVKDERGHEYVVADTRIKKKISNNNDSKKDFHFAGEELYSEDPNRFGDKLRKINDKMNSPLDSSLKGLNKIDSIAGDDEKLQTLGRKIGANSLVKYRNAWEEYRKEHPNSKISLYQFIKMNEE